MKTGFCTKKSGENCKIPLAYNRLIHHSNDNDKDVHPLISPKIRMAKVSNDEKPKKQILDQTHFCGKQNPYSAKKAGLQEFLTVFV